METPLKRLYVGGLSPLVTKTELANRFGKFGKIDDVDIICRKDEQGNPIKTFAYLNINISDGDLKKCISILNKTKWKGGILQIEMAKESFLHRLSQERLEAKEKNKGTARCSQNDPVLPLATIAVPGTEVPNHKDSLTSLNVMKYDPSKYCHNLKSIEDTFELVPVSQLTWQLQGGDEEISRKRRGEFPNLVPSTKRKNKLLKLPISGGTRIDRMITFGSMQTIKCQSDTKMPLHTKKLGQLPNKSINSMTDESNSKDELEAIFKSEQANSNFADNCNIEVVDDSFNLGYITCSGKPKAAPKIFSTSNAMDDSEYDSANTDEIITVAKTVQKSLDYFKTKAETIKRDAIKILDCDGSSFACGTKGKCKSSNTEMSKLESESKSVASEDDGSNFYSDEEYKAMIQNCCKMDLTVGNLETLAKEANEFEDEKNTHSRQYDTDDIHVNKVYVVAKNPQALGSEILTASEKIQISAQPSVEIKNKLKPKIIQSSVSESSDLQSYGYESEGSSDFDEQYESINKSCARDSFMFESPEPKSTVLQWLDNNEELLKVAKGVKGKTKVSKKNPGTNNVKQKDLESKDIVASILEIENGDQRSINRKKKDAPVKPPAFKGLGSMLASAAIVSSLSSSFRMSSVKTSAISEISKDLSLSSCSSKQTKRAEKQPSKDFKRIFLKAESKNGSDTSDECNSAFGLAAGTEVEHNISQVDKAKEQTMLKVKQQRDNQKRLVAIMEWRKERELQKQIIQGALLHLDSQCSKKSQHVVFSSESASEKEDDASTSADNKTKQNTSKLFSSSDEDSDNEDNEVDERFKIKAQYEGRSGIKLMELQSSFGKDERFKMDSRFLEISSEDDEASDGFKSHVDEEYDLSAEKKKNLDIMQSILNINMESQPATKQTTNGKKNKYLNVLHYDPTNADHATLAPQAEERKESKYEKTKKLLEKENLPDVPKETFHEIIMDLKEVFGTSKTQDRKVLDATWDQEVEPKKKKAKSNESFSFQNTEEPVEFTFSFFGDATERRTCNNEPYKVEPIKPAKVAWQEDPRFQDSSEGEDDEVDVAGAAENKSLHRIPLLVSTRPDISTIRFFFFEKDDERLKTGPTVFFRSSNTKQEEEAWEQRKDILLEECRKKHKDAKRKIKARN